MEAESLARTGCFWRHFGHCGVWENRASRGKAGPWISDEGVGRAFPKTEIMESPESSVDVAWINGGSLRVSLPSRLWICQQR